jgi:hypothetical protein
VVLFKYFILKGENMENNNSEDRKDNIKPGTILGFRFPPKENLEDIENDPDYWENNNPEE